MRRARGGPGRAIHFSACDGILYGRPFPSRPRPGAIEEGGPLRGRLGIRPARGGLIYIRARASGRCAVLKCEAGGAGAALPRGGLGDNSMQDWNMKGSVLSRPPRGRAARAPAGRGMPRTPGSPRPFALGRMHAASAAAASRDCSCPCQKACPSWPPRMQSCTGGS